MIEPHESTLPEGWKRYRSSEMDVRPLFLQNENGLVVELYATPELLLRAQNAPLSVIKWALEFADYLHALAPKRSVADGSVPTGAPVVERKDEEIRRLTFDMKELDDGAVVVDNFIWGNDTSDEAQPEGLTKMADTWTEAIEHVEALLKWLKSEIPK